MVEAGIPVKVLIDTIQQLPVELLCAAIVWVFGKAAQSIVQCSKANSVYQHGPRGWRLHVNLQVAVYPAIAEGSLSDPEAICLEK